MKQLLKLLNILFSGLNQGVTGLPLKGWPLTVSCTSLAPSLIFDAYIWLRVLDYGFYPTV